MRKIVCLLLGLFTANSAIASEIAPTPKMLAEAQKMSKIQDPNSEATDFKYHFRNIDDHILWCAYVNGGNGNFCEKINKTEIYNTDRSAADYCKTANADEEAPPHAVYGELWDLDYRCKRGHMSRLPVDMALDHEGYVRSQWKPLP